MSSSFPSLKTKQLLAKDRNSSVVLLICICCALAGLFFFIGFQELYKLNTLIIRHCQVKSIDLKFVRNNFFPRWNITVTYQNETTNDILIASIGTKSDKWAWINARKYKINETYPCYRSRNKTSFIRWGWQWNQPNELTTFSFLFGGVTLLIIATILFILKRRYLVQFNNTQQHQLETPLTNEEHQ